jgi:hypothetical protein
MNSTMPSAMKRLQHVQQARHSAQQPLMPPSRMHTAAALRHEWNHPVKIIITQFNFIEISHSTIFVKYQ